MPNVAPLLIPAPALTPPRFGLLSVADIVADPNAHWQNGVEYVAPPTPGVTVEKILPTPAPGVLAPVTDPFLLVEGYPFRVLSTFKAKHPGLTAEEIHDRARQALAVGESNAVEAFLWAGAESSFMDAADTATPAGTTAVSILSGLGSLERWLWDTYGGTGVLHVARELVPVLARLEQVEERNGRLVTPLGTVVAAGSYPGTGPDGSAPAAGSAWVAATGAVEARRSEVRMPGANGSAYFDPHTNDVVGVATRSYVVTWGGIQAAALLTLEGA